ncbi:MAG TPA: DNA polymerase III subunit delta [Gammaproteobacteria bacterium]|nr:DNA polymerase III subunit delta [Gammaproteobacteria bacterium]
MKITASQLAPHFAETLGKVYLISGDEPFLVQETLSFIRQKAALAGFSDRLRLDIETDTDLENCYTHAYTSPLLAQKRLLELHWKGKLSKTGQQFLQHYALHPAPHSLLVVRLGKLDSKTEKSAWFKALEKRSVLISIWPLAAKHLPAWLLQRAKAQKLELTPDAARLLAHLVEGNLQAGAQELDKLSLVEQTPIDRATVESLVMDQGCFTAFDLVLQALTGNGPEILRILHYLQKEGCEPLLILGAFTFELRTLAKIARDLQKGSSLHSLFAAYHIRFNKEASFREFFKRGGELHLFDFFLKAAEIDRLAKGAAPGQVWIALEELSLAIAGIGYKLN